MRILPDGINVPNHGDAASSPRRGNGPDRPDHAGPPDHVSPPQSVTGASSDFDARVSDATVDEVLGKVDAGEWDADEVLAAERRGKGRAGIVNELGDGSGTDDDD